MRSTSERKGGMVEWLVLAVVLGLDGGAATDASAPPAAPRLSGLEAGLQGTGRIAAVKPSPSPIEAPAPGTPAADRAGLTKAPAPEQARGSVPSGFEARAGLAEEFRPTEAPVSACRVEVARRRQVTPDKVAAGTVVVRFTVEENGRVRDAEAVSQSGTDLEVAACAKRVLSEWLFAKRQSGEITVERTYRF
jgi:TonB family protein